MTTLLTIKAQGLHDVADPDFDPDHGDQYDKQLFEEKQSFVYFWYFSSDKQMKRIVQGV